ncbi:MAG: 30S ribosomal protein S20 [Deltaproteobacteria bacterium]|nr:30S ribosomal protein S20 [Deltaproteobacteria bacterium]
MANHKSAIKRLRQSEKRRLRNNSIKSAIKTAIKKVRTSISDGNSDEATLNLKKAASLLDAAVTKGVLHRNNASNKISRLTVATNNTTAK